MPDTKLYKKVIKPYVFIHDDNYMWSGCKIIPQFDNWYPEEMQEQLTRQVGEEYKNLLSDAARRLDCPFSIEFYEKYIEVPEEELYS